MKLEVGGHREVTPAFCRAGDSSQLYYYGAAPKKRGGGLIPKLLRGTIGTEGKLT